MIAVLVAVVLVLVVALAVYIQRAPDDPAAARDDALVRLHAIRAHLLVARHKHETRRRADKVRRELRRELGEHKGG